MRFNVPLTGNYHTLSLLDQAGANLLAHLKGSLLTKERSKVILKFSGYSQSKELKIYPYVVEHDKKKMGKSVYVQFLVVKPCTS